MFERISIDPQVCHGKPCIKDTRIMVWQILDLLSNGISIGTIISDDYFPDLSEEDVKACVSYANQLVKNEEIHFFQELEPAAAL